MAPKEKAKEIFDKMYLVEDQMANYPMCFDTAKQCALIAVDEILNEYPSQCPKDSYEMERHIFWQEVKEELLKITFYGTTRNY